MHHVCVCVCHRWDYGYQITSMANRTVIVDNNTWNNTHIATVGRAMASNEDDAYAIMQVRLCVEGGERKGGVRTLGVRVYACVVLCRGQGRGAGNICEV